MVKPLIFHIDVNSAFLSWSACHRLSLGETLDIRTIPSVIGGDEEKRHGIVLAKSTPAKAYGIVTAEPLARARQKCPNLFIDSPNFDVYVKYSNAFLDILRKYAPVVEQYSIDEAFCDMSGTSLLYKDPIEFAYKLKDTIKDELGFTVNIGISSNKLLAKMASDFTKPDKVHTLFPEEISTKLWPLPVDDLFFVGHSSASKLHSLGINTIGQLATTDVAIIKYHLKKQGEVIHGYANGKDLDMSTDHTVSNKGYGNSVTLSFDINDATTAKKILLSLCETVSARIRSDKSYVGVIGINMVDCDFNHHTRQITLDSPTNITEKIYDTVCQLFDQYWNKVPLRLIGVTTAKATTDNFLQFDLFDQEKFERLSKLNKAVDTIRDKFGEDSLKRACFVDNDNSHMTGGLNKAKRENKES